MQEKLLLDVYYYIDLNDCHDISYIENYLKVYLNVYKQNYKLNVFQNCNVNKAYNVKSNDIIKKGLIIFNKMYMDLKMKNINDTWYIYISNGDIENIHKNVFVLLINQSPFLTKSLYMINKNKLDILKTYSQKTKILNSNVLKITLNEIFKSEKYINYSNLLE
jgi:hypothetical protein